MNPLIFQKAAEKDADRIFTLYQSLVGTPYCAWDKDYPNLEIIQEDIALGGLYMLSRESELIAAGAVRHLPEHDKLSCWPPMKNPCDLLRIGVAQSYQGQGIGRFFLKALLSEAERKHFDCMRILVAKTNLPAIALYRRMGIVFYGETFSYGIDWFCGIIPVVPAPRNHE